jgi:hypothetical protein
MGRTASKGLTDKTEKLPQVASRGFGGAFVPVSFEKPR